MGQSLAGRRPAAMRCLPPLQPQDNMPDPATAPADPATDMPRAVDVDAIGVPDAPADAVADSGSSTADAGTDGPAAPATTAG